MINKKRKLFIIKIKGAFKGPNKTRKSKKGVLNK